MNNFERRFGKFTITNLTMYIIIGKVFCFLLELFNSSFVNMLTLDPSAVMSGQIWRLITFIFIPNSSPIWFIFEIMFLYWVGTGLESVWGSFRYTMYFLSGILGVAAAVIAGYFLGFYVNYQIFQMTYAVSSLFSYTLFLPFAWYYGNEEIRIMMIIPIKVKYLAVVDALLILQMFVATITMPQVWLIFIFSMINMFVFYAVVLFRRGKQKTRLAGFKHKITKAERNGRKNAIHRCAICGITEKDDPGMSFRFCSKCEGDYEFCEKHLGNHEHFKKVVEFKKPL